MELFSNNAAGFLPESGQEILQIRDFSVSEPISGLYKISITDSRGENTLIYAGIRSTGEKAMQTGKGGH